MTAWLQWGRAGEGTEIYLCGRDCSTYDSGFNGAVPVKARKFRDEVLHTHLCDLLQWGRAGEGTEIQLALFVASLTRKLQWGRAGEGTEMTAPIEARFLVSAGFNGAVPVKARKSRPAR